MRGFRVLIKTLKFALKSVFMILYLLKDLSRNISKAWKVQYLVLRVVRYRNKETSQVTCVILAPGHAYLLCILPILHQHKEDFTSYVCHPCTGPCISSHYRSNSTSSSIPMKAEQFRPFNTIV